MVCSCGMFWSYSFVFVSKGQCCLAFTKTDKFLVELVYIFIANPFVDTKSAMPCVPRLMDTFSQITVRRKNGTDVVFLFCNCLGLCAGKGWG